MKLSSHLPSSKSQFALASALGDNALVLLQASADDTGGDSQVSVVAITEVD